MAVYVGAHHFQAPNTNQIDFPSFESLSPSSLANALLPTTGQGHQLSAFPLSTILIIGSDRDKLRDVPIVRTYTTDFCHEIVHRLQACHNYQAIDISVVYKSELVNEPQRRQIQIPKMESGKKVDSNTMNDWFLVNERMSRRSANIFCHAC